MREGDIRSTTFQTKTDATSEKFTPSRVVEEVSRRSQTGAIGLDGRKAENALLERVADDLEEARLRWLRNQDEHDLKSTLLRLLLKLETTN